MLRLSQAAGCGCVAEVRSSHSRPGCVAECLRSGDIHNIILYSIIFVLIFRFNDFKDF